MNERGLARMGGPVGSIWMSTHRFQPPTPRQSQPAAREGNPHPISCPNSISPSINKLPFLHLFLYYHDLKIPGTYSSFQSAKGDSFLLEFLLLLLLFFTNQESLHQLFAGHSLPFLGQLEGEGWCLFSCCERFLGRVEFIYLLLQPVLC